MWNALSSIYTSVGTERRDSSLALSPPPSSPRPKASDMVKVDEVQAQKMAEDYSCNGSRTAATTVVCGDCPQQEGCCRSSGEMMKKNSGGLVVQTMIELGKGYENTKVIDAAAEKKGDDTIAEAVVSTTTASIPSSLIFTPNSGEMQYLNLVQKVLETGKLRDNRTGVQTYSLFGQHMRFDLNDSFPLLTTRRIYWRGIVEELLWFLRGSTDSNELSARGVRIWDKNGCRDFLDRCGFVDRKEGDLGPVYGFQWRHSGAQYRDHRTDYTGLGVDQIKNVIEKIRTDPTDRRMIVCAWNPTDVPKMVLPPCHVLVQFYVDDGKLSGQMYQRSADLGLGVPFNIASYSLLIHMMAHVTGLKPGEFIHTLGDCHVYANHRESLMRQLERAPRAFPKLVITRNVMDIDDFTPQDFEIVDYRPHPRIDMEMVA